ncbi:unnamed protein product [Rotaria socialis]
MLFFTNIGHPKLYRCEVSTMRSYHDELRIIIGHERKDLGEIKLEYSKIYDETLDETIENRVDIEEIKKLFLMIITTGRHATSSNCRNIDLDHKIQNRSSGQGTSPITTKLRKKFSHDALDKLSHVF